MLSLLPHSPSLQSTRPRGALRVLVVDDDSLVRWALGCMLSDHGCFVVESQDAQSAIRAVADRSNLFDVILLDRHLPDGDGLELLTKLQQLVPQSRLLMMSADMSADEVDEAARCGASALLPKPFDLDDVWRLVCQYGRPAN